MALSVEDCRRFERIIDFIETHHHDNNGGMVLIDVAVLFNNMDTMKTKLDKVMQYIGDGIANS